ncbi:baseplate J/gp47 family protein [Pseudomonas sp. NPDC086581]|uniref:baseplate assembly protein n=1 Tax=Pseudomonas sp. NPDC086581 TaxID=3364432 RepID=UPI003827E922
MSSIDLSNLPAPPLIESLDYETIYQQQLADFRRAMGEGWSAPLESDPIVKLLEVVAYRELLLRARVNDAARGVMLAYAVDGDLDQIGAGYDVARLLIDPGDPQAIPPRQPVYESNVDFRRRIQLSFEGYTTAGSMASYVFHGLGASADVADISAVSPIPGSVTVYVLGREGTGKASDTLLAVVAAGLNAEHIRPLTDRVTVQSASIVNYRIVAELVMLPGPDSAVVLAAAQSAIANYTREQHALSRDITLSGVYHALHQPGVQRVNLTSPNKNLVIGPGEASYCTEVVLTVAGETDV